MVQRRKRAKAQSRGCNSVEKTRCGGTLTEAAFWGFLRSGLRAKYQKWGPRFAALLNARSKYEGRNPRQRWQFECAICKNQFAQKEVEVDHITPCGSLRGWDDLVGFTQRLFCEIDGLRVLCKSCHKQVTKESK